MNSHVAFINDSKFVFGNSSDLREMCALVFRDEILEFTLSRYVVQVDGNYFILGCATVGPDIELRPVIRNSTSKSVHTLGISTEQNSHVVLGIKFIDNLVPLHVRADFILLKISNPEQIFLQGACQ